MASISKSTLQFLKDLKENNNREWFNANKNRYLEAQSNMVEFADAILEDLGKTDLIETPNGKKAIFRIYRDVRFSADKSPYKTNLAGFFKRATASLRGGYYFQIQPGNSFSGGGFWNPNSEDLKRIRDEFHQDDTEIRAIISSKPFKSHFGELRGEKVKTAPKGFAKDDPAIDLIRYKQFTVMQPYSDKELTKENFHLEIVKSYKAMRPFFDYMSDVLTTDLDGRSLID